MLPSASVRQFRSPQGLQSAAAYYVLHHTRLLWISAKNPGIEVQKRPSSLPPDLFLHIHGEEWGGDALLSDVVLAAHEGWLRLPNLRPTLEGLDFPRRLHNVGIETCHPDHQLSFLETIEILSG